MLTGLYLSLKDLDFFLYTGVTSEAFKSKENNRDLS